MNKVKINNDIEVGLGRPFLLVAGPCVLESEELALEVALHLQEVTRKLGISYVFKASFDKANRTSLSSFRGPGIVEGLDILARIKEHGIAVVSDIHTADQAAMAAEVLDIIQIPAFLCRQTDLLVAAAKTNKPVAVKKGQFLAPWDMEHAVRKIKESGNDKVILMERGATFGYNNFVVDMRSFPIMRDLGCPVIFDATHSVQLPGGAGGSSSGQRQFVAPLARAAVAAGIDGLFLEVHPDPDKALCDGPNSLALDQVEPLLAKLQEIHALVNS